MHLDGVAGLPGLERLPHAGGGVARPQAGQHDEEGDRQVQPVGVAEAALHRRAVADQTDSGDEDDRQADGGVAGDDVLSPQDGRRGRVAPQLHEGGQGVGRAEHGDDGEDVEEEQGLVHGREARGGRPGGRPRPARPAARR